MERTRGTSADGKKFSRWLPEIDRIFLVGMKHGPLGIRQATNKVLSLRTGLTRADCWKRLRFLRKRSNGNHPAPRNWPREIKDLLRQGYEQGGQKKREAIKAVRELYPGLPSHTPSRFACRQGWIKRVVGGQRRPWSEHEERKLWELAGYEPAARIGERLGRSEGAVRCRLKVLGLSVRVKDGWSLRALQGLLHVGPFKLRRFIVAGSLRVRDPRIAVQSLAALWEKRIASAIPSIGDGVLEAQRQKLRKGPRAYSWGSAAKFLGVSVDEVRRWIAKGDLKIVDGFVTERAFQDFCNKCGTLLNGTLLGQEIRDWLAEGFTLQLPAGEDIRSVPPSERHALVTRQCPKCQRRMRGNVFFKHLKNCKGSTSENKLTLAAPSRLAEFQSNSRIV